MRSACLAMATLLLAAGLARAQEYLKVLDSRPLDFLTEVGSWTATGGPESTVKMVADPEQPARHALQFSVTTDLQGPAGAQYLAGWPSCGYEIKPPQDWRGYNRIAFRIRVDSPDKGRIFPVRFILHTAGKTSMNKLVPGLKPGKWVQASFDLTKLPEADKVDLAHLFVCEDEYPDKLQMSFTVADFRLEKTETLDNYLPPRECTAALYCGEGEQWTLLNAGTPELPCVLKLRTGAECALQPTDSIVWKLRSIFTETRYTGQMPLGRAVAAGGSAELPFAAVTKLAAPGYYLLTADAQRGGKSLCGGRVGADDLYVKKPGEKMAYTALCYRLGTASWLVDRVYGGLMTNGSVVLPHTYDPFDKETYPLWLKGWCSDSGKNSEGLEAGVTGLVFACEALRRAGDRERCRFAERMLQDCLDYMVKSMQDPDGGVKIITNEIAQTYGEVLGDMGWMTASRDCNQTGEWVRPIARAILYFRNVKGREQYARQLLQASVAAAEFIVRTSTDRVGDREHVLRHYGFPPYTPGSDARDKRRLYHQEGRQCEVYVGRAMSGVSYVAYALAVCGKPVPADWLTMLRETTAWAKERMEPRGGWFDWGCEDVVEGGCHTFLGNQYIGEGTMGEYMLERQLGNRREAALAAEATRLAYHYITDNCTIRGQRFGIPSEFWVGPYLYWELAEYNRYVGPDPVFAQWMQGITDIYVKQNQWQDFTDRQGAKVGRARGNGSLVTSILGWLGLYYMDEIGKPWKSYTEMGKG